MRSGKVSGIENGDGCKGIDLGSDGNVLICGLLGML